MQHNICINYLDAPMRFDRDWLVMYYILYYEKAVDHTTNLAIGWVLFRTFFR